MIEYIEDGHLYLNSDGVIIPSVSELCKIATNKSFDNIPSFILEKAANHGTNVHDSISKYLNGEKYFCSSVAETLAVDEFKRLITPYLNQKISSEMLVDYKELWAGRIDLLIGTELADIKTTFKLDLKWLEWQLGFYKYALETHRHKITSTKAIWLPKNHAGQIVDVVPHTLEECLEVYDIWLKRKKEELSKLPF